MTADDELVRAIGEAILAEARKWPVLPGDRYGARSAPMGATGEDLGRAALAAVDAAGWRPPQPKHDLRMMRSLIAGIIDGHFGDDHRETATAAAEEIIGRGWLDKVADVGPPEPVATTLRRIIRDLEDQAAGPQRHTHAGIALSQYADRLRGHPALDGGTIGCWPPLPDSETEWGRRWPRTNVVQEFGSRQEAEDGAFPGTELVHREVGPWIEVTS